MTNLLLRLRKIGGRLIQIVHLVVLLVVPSEDEPESDGHDACNDANNHKHPYKVWILAQRSEGNIKGTRDGRRE